MSNERDIALVQAGIDATFKAHAGQVVAGRMISLDPATIAATVPGVPEWQHTEAITLVVEALVAIVSNAGNTKCIADALIPWRERAQSLVRNYGRPGATAPARAGDDIGEGTWSVKVMPCQCKE